MPNSLTDQEKFEIRDNLGYLSTHPVASLVAGIPTLSQTMYLLESSMMTVMEVAVPRIRQILCEMNKIRFTLIPAATDNLLASKLGDLTPREDAIPMLEMRYAQWGRDLANIFGCMPYPYSSRYSGPNAQSNGNVPVRGNY